MASDFSRLETFLFKEKDNDLVTEQFLLYHVGEVKFEKFEKGDSNTRHLLWSMSKSIGSLLFGVAQDRGFIKKSDPISRFYSAEIAALPKRQQKYLNKIKIENLLEMSSGFDWNEYYEESPFNSNVVRMLYFSAKKSTPNYVLKTLKYSSPGKRFHYSSGDTNLLMGAIARSLPKELKDIYPWVFLFQKLGIDATFERDAEGNFLASSYVYMSTEDLLKVGVFVMNKGMYKGEQVVSKEYMEYATSLNGSFSYSDNCEHHTNMTYGAQFWLNTPCPNQKKNISNAPKDMIMMLGHGGQSIFIFPSQKIVAVRVARDKGNKLNKNTYVGLIMESLGLNGESL
jgi:CubicO group peptidase (beta-lactamase class C family)